MKSFVFLSVCVFALVLASCGSSWEIHGNNMTIIKAVNDTIAPAGSYIMLPSDSDSTTFSHVQ